MAYKQISLAKFGVKNRNIQTSDKNNNIRGKSEKRKITKNIYEAEKRCRTFVASWSKQFPGIEDTANGVQLVCSVCLGSTKRRLDWMVIKYHLSFMAASLIWLHWGKVTFWGGQVDLIPICPAGDHKG